MGIVNLKIASRYAKALIDQALVAGVLDKVYQDALLLTDVLSTNKDLNTVLQNPTIKNQKKLSVLSSLFKDKVDQLTFTFFSLISYKKREGLLSAIMSAFVAHYHTHKNIKSASVTTTFKLSTDLSEYFKNLIKILFDCKEVVLKEYINPSIQGGFILRVADKQLDNSLSGRLKKLKKQFSIIEY